MPFSSWSSRPRDQTCVSCVSWIAGGFFTTVPPGKLFYLQYWIWKFLSPGGLLVKKTPANAGDAGAVGLIPGSGRSPGVGNGNPLQYSCLENSVDRGAWQATVHRATKSQTQLSWCWVDSASERRLKFPLKTIEDMKSIVKKRRTVVASGGDWLVRGMRKLSGVMVRFYIFDCFSKISLFIASAC